MRNPAFCPFDTILECDRRTQTDRQTDRHTTTAYTTLALRHEVVESMLWRTELSWLPMTL